MLIEELREVVAAPGPFASVYVDASHDTEDAARLTELHRRSVQSELTGLGADSDLSELVGDALADEPPVGPAGRAIIAGNGRVLAAETLPMPPAGEQIRFSALPYLMPLLATARRSIPYVVANVDRVGAEFAAVNRAGEQVPAPDVHGVDHPVHQVRGTGWSQRTTLNRVAETVQHNVNDIAAHATKLIDEVGAELLVIAGEVQGRRAVHDALPARGRDIAVELDKPDLVDALLAERQAMAELAALEKFRERHGRGDAVAGLPEVAGALRGGQVDVLLVSDPLLADQVVWRGPDLTQITTDPADLPEATGQLAETRADEALPAAAIATGANVLVLPEQESFTDGVAALLRYS